jgi:glyoxylase-like metal-dependent hydrolase (beta-lactamase superfamily II)
MRQLDSEDKVKVGDVEVSCLHTPGHTPGSQCFRVGDRLVAGDTLFLQGCGRVDLPGGNSEELYRTLTQRLAKIQDEIVLYPGHNYGSGPSAPMGDVRRTNSLLQINRVEDWFSIMGR